MQPSCGGALWYWQQQVLDALFRRRHRGAAFVVCAVYVRSSVHLSFHLISIMAETEQRGCIGASIDRRQNEYRIFGKL